MNSVLIFGAGKSSLYLIEYLAAFAEANQKKLIVCDRDTTYARKHIRPGLTCTFTDLDIDDEKRVISLIVSSELVVSLLPAFLHIRIAGLCLQLRKNLATASYISDEMRALNEQVRSSDLIFLNECGLDPGIDHMSAMQMMDKIRSEGARITGFKSYCGGLVADEYDGDNPWKYKFSWNPRNVVLAAQGAPATYLSGGAVKLRPYHRVFDEPETFDIEGYGVLEAYPNRDSLHYTEMYGLEGVSEMLRGTFRKPGFCKAWQVLVLLGLTDDSAILNFGETDTMKQWMATYIGMAEDQREAVKKRTGCSEKELDMLQWLGFFTDSPLPLKKGSSAAILEELLKLRWKLQASDRDLVVMLHEICYQLGGKDKRLRASMVLKGESATHTAMAKTVGLPLAIACRLILENKVSARGVIAPVEREFYDPVMQELKSHGIDFVHHDSSGPAS